MRRFPLRSLIVKWRRWGTKRWPPKKCFGKQPSWGAIWEADGVPIPHLFLNEFYLFLLIMKIIIIIEFCLIFGEVLQKCVFWCHKSEVTRKSCIYTLKFTILLGLSYVVHFFTVILHEIILSVVVSYFLAYLTHIWYVELLFLWEG